MASKLQPTRDKVNNNGKNKKRVTALPGIAPRVPQVLTSLAGYGASVAGAPQELLASDLQPQEQPWQQAPLRPQEATLLPQEQAQASPRHTGSLQIGVRIQVAGSRLTIEVSGQLAI